MLQFSAYFRDGPCAAVAVLRLSRSSSSVNSLLLASILCGSRTSRLITSSSNADRVLHLPHGASSG